MAQAVQATEFSIGYIELSYAITNGIQFAQLKNRDDGNFVTASLSTTASAAAEERRRYPQGTATGPM